MTFVIILGVRYSGVKLRGDAKMNPAFKAYSF